MAICPKCGSELMNRKSKSSGVEYLMCRDWKTCGVVLTAEALGCVNKARAETEHARREAEQSRAMMLECRRNVLEIAKQYADQESGEREESLRMGNVMRLGDVLPKPEQFEEWMGRRKSK